MIKNATNSKNITFSNYKNQNQKSDINYDTIK